MAFPGNWNFLTTSPSATEHAVLDEKGMDRWYDVFIPMKTYSIRKKKKKTREMNEINRAKQDLYISAEWGWKAVIFTGENPSSKLINNHSMR